MAWVEGRYFYCLLLQFLRNEVAPSYDAHSSCHGTETNCLVWVKLFLAQWRIPILACCIHPLILLHLSSSILHDRESVPCLILSSKHISEVLLVWRSLEGAGCCFWRLLLWCAHVFGLFGSEPVSFLFDSSFFLKGWAPACSPPHLLAIPITMPLNSVAYSSFTFFRTWIPNLQALGQPTPSTLQSFPPVILARSGSGLLNSRMCGQCCRDQSQVSRETVIPC